MPTFEDAEKLVKERITWFRKWTDDIPNYTHSLNVRDLLKKYWFNETVQMAGLLHDIVEDWNTSFDELRELWYPEEVIELVDLATHNMNIENPTDEEKFQRWKDMMKRLEEADNKDAWAIKLADITDNVASCHTMKNDEKKMRFMCIKCPYFIEQWRKIFWESDFYLEFTGNYAKQLLRYIDFSKVWHWENWEFRLTPEIHIDERWKYIYVEWVVFRAVFWTKDFSWFWYGGFGVWWNHNAFYIWEWVEWKMTWYWRIFYDDWDTYNWHLINWVRDWIWEMNMPEIWESYSWEWKDDKMHGYGRWVYSDWSEYVWYWVDWQRQW